MTAPRDAGLGATVAGDISPATEAARSARVTTGAALVVVGTMLAAGVLVGVVWSLVAPTVACTMRDTGCAYTYESGRFFVAEGIFAALTAGGGIVAAVLAGRWIRHLGWPIAVALAVGGLVASVVAWRVGVWFGPQESAIAATALGETAELPLRLRTAGLLLSASISSSAIALWITLSGPDPALDG